MKASFTNATTIDRCPLMLCVFLCASSLASQDSANLLKIEQLVRRTVGARIALRTYVTVVIAPNTLAADTIIIAELDLDNNTLTVNTKDAQKLTGRVSVEINSDRFPNGLTVLLQAPMPVLPPSKLTFIGTLTGADSAARTLSVDSANEFREFAVPLAAFVKRQENEQEPFAVTLADLGLGDQVTVALLDDGRTPKSIVAKYKVVSGAVRAIAARRIVLDDGLAYNVSQNVLVTSTKNDELEMADLKIGQRVKLRLNPLTNEAWEITLGNLRGTMAASPGDAPRPPARSDRLPAPQITSPKDGEEADSTIVIMGRTVSNAKVTIKISYLRKGLINSKGNLPDVEAKADAKGDFATQPLALRGPRLLEDEVVYTITVVATRADGKQSEEALVRVVRK